MFPQTRATLQKFGGSIVDVLVQSQNHMTAVNKRKYMFNFSYTNRKHLSSQKHIRLEQDIIKIERGKKAERNKPALNRDLFLAHFQVIPNHQYLRTCK